MIAVLLCNIALAQDPAWGVEGAAAPPESRRALAQQVEPEAAEPKAVSAFALVQTRGTVNNLVSTNPFLDGQVLGTLGGTNGITTAAEQRSAYVEQRVAGFASWSPTSLDGKATLSYAAEVDFAWGDSAYGTGGNTGGGFGADQVNLQTRRLHVDVKPTLGGGHELVVVTGLQFIADSATNPSATGPDGLLRSGGRLMFWGSEAAGITVYGSFDDAVDRRVQYKLGSYTLLEQGLGLPDDVWLTMADVQVRPAYAFTLGGHAWYLQDRSGGTGGPLGIGPTSGLSEMQGGPARDLYDEGFPAPADATVDADLVWVGADAGFNSDLTRGPFGLHGVAIANLGKLYAPIAHDDPIAGWLFDAEARLRYAPGTGSILRAEALVSSADNADIQRHTSVITGNSYGFAGALHATHGMRLLFPDPASINRMVSVVHDVSGAGYGATGITAGAAYDVVPDRVNLAVNAGTVSQRAFGSLGTEVNAGVRVTPLPLMTLTATYVAVQATAASGLPANPTAGYLDLEWLAF